MNLLQHNLVVLPPTDQFCQVRSAQSASPRTIPSANVVLNPETPPTSQFSGRQPQSPAEHNVRRNCRCHWAIMCFPNVHRQDPSADLPRSLQQRLPLRTQDSATRRSERLIPRFTTGLNWCLPREGYQAVCQRLSDRRSVAVRRVDFIADGHGGRWWRRPLSGGYYQPNGTGHDQHARRCGKGS